MFIVIVSPPSVFFSITGDNSSSETTDKADIDSRISQTIDIEDPEVVADLCSLSTPGTIHFGMSATNILVTIPLLMIEDMEQ